MSVATQLAVFYATDSKILRRKVVPDHDAQFAGLNTLPGESMILLSLAEPYDDEACRAAIAAATGARIPSGRCCVIDDAGNVIGVCNADPALDEHLQGKLVASDDAGLGDRHVGSAFLRRYAIVSNITQMVTATAWLPISRSSADGSAGVIDSPMAEIDRIGSKNTSLCASLSLQVGDAAPASYVAVPFC
jgi:hypothetical protein